MKKNVFSRAMAVLASVAVLGAASMMSASAAGVSGGSVTAKPGDEVSVPFNVVDIPGCAGAELTFTADAPLTVTGVSAAMSDAPVSGGIAGVFVNGNGWSGTTVTVKVAADAAPGSYPVYVAITEGADGIDDGNQGYVENPQLLQGTVVVEAEATEPEPTTTEPVTTVVADTTAAPVTTAKPTTVKAATTSAPKTGTAGVAVAVAGLVTAGATAVVLKKKH